MFRSIWIPRRHGWAANILTRFFVSSNGMAIHPESAPGYCRDNPGVHEAELKFYTSLAEDAKKSPAFLGWDLWSEPHVINWANADLHRSS